MVSTQCPKCGKVLNDKEALNEGQAIDKHQTAGCDTATAAAPANSLEEAIRKARGA